MKTKLTITPEISWIIKEFDKECEEYVYMENYDRVKNISIPLAHSIITMHKSRDSISSIIYTINRVDPIIATLKYNGNVTLEGNEVLDWNTFMELASPWISQGVHIHNAPATVEYSKGVQ
jgi:hypothetical protein